MRTAVYYHIKRYDDEKTNVTAVTGISERLCFY
nr:hypothetical protein NNFBJPFD_00346 [Enterobacter cloacae]